MRSEDPKELGTGIVDSMDNVLLERCNMRGNEEETFHIQQEGCTDWRSSSNLATMGKADIVTNEEVHLMCTTMDAHHEWDIVLFQLCGHTLQRPSNIFTPFAPKHTDFLARA